MSVDKSSVNSKMKKKKITIYIIIGLLLVGIILIIFPKNVRESEKDANKMQNLFIDEKNALHTLQTYLNSTNNIKEERINGYVYYPDLNLYIR